MIRPEIIHTSNIIRTKQVCVKENEVRGHEFERTQVGGGTWKELWGGKGKMMQIYFISENVE